MAVDDYLEPPVAVAAVAAAALLSPQVRGVMRKGLVYGTAGVMTAGDAAASLAKGAGEGVQRVVGRGSNSTPRRQSASSGNGRSSASSRRRSPSTKSRARRRATASS